MDLLPRIYGALLIPAGVAEIIANAGSDLWGVAFGVLCLLAAPFFLWV